MVVGIKRHLNCRRRLGGDGRKEGMAATGMSKGLLRSLRKWCIGYPYLEEWGGVCLIGCRAY